MGSQKKNWQFSFAFVSFAISVLLAILLLASFGSDWGTAYGQTAGPTPTLTTSPAEGVAGVTINGSAPTVAPVIPGVPRTGGGFSQVIKATQIEAWKVAVLSAFALIMLTSLVLMLRLKFSKK